MKYDYLPSHEESKVEEESVVQNDFFNQDYVHSEDEKSAEILDAYQDKEGNTYFQVRFPQHIQWLTHRKVKRDFPFELITFYEKHLTF